MKSRGATYLLLLAVVAVWGVIGWKIVAPQAPVRPEDPVQASSVSAPQPATDSLRLDYPDPFLKNQTPHPRPTSVVRSLPRRQSAPKRERIALVHLGTVVSEGRTLHILTIGGEQYEARLGGTAGGFQLATCDNDSLYLTKEGINYGVKLCE